MVVTEKLLVDVTEGAQGGRHPVVRASQVIRDPKSGVARATKPVDRAGRSRVESGNA